MIEHTPGPWRAKFGYSGLNGCRVIGRGDVHVVTLSRKADKSIRQKQADLHLIETAPELLSALKDLLQYLDDHDWGTVPEGATAERARAAVVSAERLNDLPCDQPNDRSF